MQPTAQAVGGLQKDRASPGGAKETILKGWVIFCRPAGAIKTFCPHHPRLTAWAAFFRRFAAASVRALTAAISCSRRDARSDVRSMSIVGRE